MPMMATEGLKHSEGFKDLMGHAKLDRFATLNVYQGYIPAWSDNGQALLEM